MELFRLMGSIIVEDKDAIKTLNDFDNKTKNAQKTLAKFGKQAVMAGTAIAAGFSAMLVVGIKDAMYAEEKIAQLDAVLASTGGTAGMTRESLIELAEGFEKTTKFSAEAALEAQSLLLTFTNIGKDTFPRATKAAADMATAMGTDMAGQSIALGKALNDPIAGIASLTRVGVQFTDEQKNAIKTMVESGDVIGAQTVILEELEKQFGGSAEAAGKTFAGQLEILKNGFGNVAEEMAVKLMPYLQKFLDWINRNMPTIERVFDDAMNTVIKGIEWVTDNLDWLLPVLAGVLAGFVAFQIISVVSALFTVITGAIAGASGAMAIFNAIMLAFPIALVAIAIAALVTGIILLWQNWDIVAKFFSSTFDSIKKGFESFVNGIIDGMNWIIEKANDVLGTKMKVVDKINLHVGGTNTGKAGGLSQPVTSASKTAKLSKYQEFADGGLVYGEIIGKVGEYGNVKSNPEVIAPLSDLQGILKNTTPSINYDLLANKMVKAMSKVSIVLDDDKVGTFVDRRILKGAV